MNSPWGEVQHADPITGGVIMVQTAGHGGFMIMRDAMKKFHPALKLASVYGGSFQGGYTCFEEDCEAAAVIYEMQEAGIDISTKGFKTITKEGVIACLGRTGTYEPYLKARKLI